VEELRVYAPQISACNSERMVKIGAELPKLFPNKAGYPFFGPPCITDAAHFMQVSGTNKITL